SGPPRRTKKTSLRSMNRSAKGGTMLGKPLVAVSAILLASCGGGGSNGGGGSGGGAATAAYSIGGTVSGLAGSGLVLQNGSSSVSPSSNGPFTFPGTFPSGTAFNVAVAADPTDPWQTCSVTSGTGAVGNANVTSVQVNCTTNTYSVGVDVVGLQGTGLVLQNNGADDLAVSADGAIVFATPVPSGAPYPVTVQAQPTASPAEICKVDAGRGTVTNASITGIAVTCRKLVGRFAYVANAGSKTISGFSIDAQTGELTELAGSPFPVTC